MHWLPGYLLSVLRRPRRVRGTRHLLFCVADHFEPYGFVSPEYPPLPRVRQWAADYEARFGDIRDADGRPPRHTFFCSAEEYNREYLDILADFCRKGYGEVEIHLHHDGDTEEGVREKLVKFRDVLRREHGLLGEWKSVQRIGNTTDCTDGLHGRIVSSGLGTHGWRKGGIAYGFVHGNWALCNSRPDGKWCGVDEELKVLAETGCYADFTFPSAPDVTQPRMVNAIYRAVDKPGGRGHDRGERIAARRRKRHRCHHSSCITPHSLMLIQGPLALNWRNRKWEVAPRLDGGDISRAHKPSRERLELWVRQHIHVRGRPEWVFVKVHTHGAVPYNAFVVVGEQMRELHDDLRRGYNDGVNWKLHYVTAREMYNIVRAAEDGMGGDPGGYRDYEVGPAGGSIPDGMPGP